MNLSADAESSVSAQLRGDLADYELYLTAERDLAPHTVRAYVSDVISLLEHAGRMGAETSAELDLGMLRSWLAKQRSMGRARSTLARRATAARMFTGWLCRTERSSADVGAWLGSPRAHRTLPAVLKIDEALALVRQAALDAPVTEAPPSAEVAAEWPRRDPAGVEVDPAGLFSGGSNTGGADPAG
ncbi:MAG: site-specific integrase, partial [Nocardioides sp.]